MADYTVEISYLSRYKWRTNMLEIAKKTDILTSEWQLTPEEVGYFYRLKERRAEEARPMVLWGWKRDNIVDGKQHPESRTVYFSADLGEDKGEVYIERAFFFLDTRAKREEINLLAESAGDVQVWEDKAYPGYSRMRMAVGDPTEYDLKTVDRRLKGKPRLSIEPPKLVQESCDYNLSRYAPFAVCVGSGLSAESGLPLLGSIHNLFEVDNMQTGELVFGASDNLPRRIAEDPEREFRKFCQFTVDAVRARPSDSHKLIASLYDRGIIRQAFTDNMDDILEKAGVPYTETRLSIFPDRYPVEFDESVKALLIVGVAVDRRDVIKQARHKGLKIISINPVFGVAPHSRNMDYLAQGDIFYRQTASDALPKIISASGF